VVEADSRQSARAAVAEVLTEAALGEQAGYSGVAVNSQ
jgi:hypothetical protein